MELSKSKIHKILNLKKLHLNDDYSLDCILNRLNTTFQITKNILYKYNFKS